VAGLGLWCTAYAGELLTPTLAGKLAWERVEYFGIATFPTLLLVFALQIAGRGRRLAHSGASTALTVVPLVTLVAVWTNEAHDLFFASSRIVVERGIALLAQERGPLFLLHAVYSYALIVAAILVLFVRFRRSAPRDRGRALLVLLGGIAPLAANAVYLAGLSPLAAFDPTPLLLCLTAAAASVGSWRGSFFAIAPATPEMLLESMSEAVMAFDHYDRLAELNAAATAILGGRREALLQRDAGTVLAPFPAVAALHQGSGESRVVIELADGRQFEVTSEDLRDELGRTATRLLLWRDVSSRRAAERALELEMDRTRAQAQQERLLVEILKAASGNLEPAAVARRAVDTVARRTRWQDVAIAVGSDQEPGLRLLAGSGVLATTPERPVVGGIIGRAFASGETQMVADVRLDPDYVAVHPATASEVAVPLARRGVVLGVLNVESRETEAFAADDVERLEAIAGAIALGLENARLHRSVLERNRELIELQRLRTDLTRTLVHDLRNPATAVVGLSEILEATATSLGAEDRESLRLLRASGERLSKLIGAILEISRLEAKTLPVQPQELALDLVAAGVVERQRVIGAARRVRIRLTAVRPTPRVRADPDLVERVIENLIDNAVRFSPDGSRVEVRIAGDDDAAFVRLEVADRGLGVAPELRGRLFEMFARGREPASGTGLGLAFCRLAVEANGGRIELADEGAEPGARFVVRLPAAPGQASETEDTRDGIEAGR
jgi:signal transduction histidine kinase